MKLFSRQTKVKTLNWILTIDLENSFIVESFFFSFWSAHGLKLFAIRNEMNYLPLSIQFEWKLKKENQRLERFRSVKILFYF